MQAIIDKNCDLVGWLNGNHLFNTNMDWIAFHTNNHFFSADNLNWLGAFNSGTLLDTNGKVVAWIMRPMRPMTPMGGWSTLNFNQWLFT
jgi:hypothetical protein